MKYKIKMPEWILFNMIFQYEYFPKYLLLNLFGGFIGKSKKEIENIPKLNKP